MYKKKVVVLTGAGISAESGLATFRDQDGLWEKHRIEDVATPEAWAKNPQLVLDFYNMRHAQLLDAKPNIAHDFLAELEQRFEVIIITQNVDDLHERAGSSKILHLHGSLISCKSSGDESFVIKMPSKGLSIGDLCPRGHQLRPNIVWFGEAVPNMDLAIPIVQSADVLIIIGTSLNVYPAAGLASLISKDATLILIDPNDVSIPLTNGFLHIRKTATEAIQNLNQALRN